MLLELGYAVKTLSWDRVICIANTDYGMEFPFDLAHNRMAFYSLKKHEKAKEKEKITSIIFQDILELKNTSPRATMRKALHVIGTYDFEKRKVIQSLTPFKLETEEYVLHNRELIKNSKKLVKEIDTLIIDSIGQDDQSKNEDNSFKNYVITESEKKIRDYDPVRFNTEKERSKTKKWLNIDVDEHFFDLGTLARKNPLFPGNEEYIGTDIEKMKYQKLNDLFYYLAQIEMRSMYLKSFDGMVYVPLAIQNISKIEDHNIRIVVHVVEGEIVNPDQHLIVEDLEGFQGLLCRNEDENYGIGIIDELFILPEDGYIHLEENDYEFLDDRERMPSLINGIPYFSEKDEIDYKEELEDYIASSQGIDYYEFEVSSTRPNECKWLHKGMLLRPGETGVKNKYQIFSSQSIGDNRGEIQWDRF